MTELYKKYRPETLEEVVGQPEAVAMLNGMFTRKGGVPHFILFTGPSGCGKTTLARIIKEAVGCGDHDFSEMNCANTRGIDMVRDLQNRAGLRPIQGKCRVWLIDEAQQLTKDAQNAFLKLLEDTPKHCYFMFATTDPDKLVATVKTRATEIVLRPVGAADIIKLLKRVVKAEQLAVSLAVIDRIAEEAQCSPRKALVILDQIMGVEGEEAQLEAVYRTEEAHSSDEIVKLLLKKAPWPAVAAVLKGCKDEDPENIRRRILGYATAVLLGGNARAFVIIDCFSKAFYDSGKAGLVAACYEACNAK
jgi:DNA polymerase-3 subunit gamma/tau